MTIYYEAEVIIGLEDIAIDEFQQMPEIDKASVRQIRAGFLRFTFTGDESNLLSLRSVIAIYSIYTFDIPRPKAILGHQNFTRLIELLSQQLQQWTEPTTTFGIGAAGPDSSVFQRIRQELAHTLALQPSDDNKGELFLRFMPNKRAQGWDILVRLSQHPLSTRKWRVKNIPGALNATVAFAMTQLANTSPHDQIINLCSGTATILIEQANLHQNNTLIAVDNDTSMLDLAQINMEYSHTDNNISQFCADAQQTPFQNRQFDIIYADLPFGHHMGSHDENEWLYPAILSESERIAKQGATFVVITHEIQLFEQSLDLSKWILMQSRQINLSGIHPYIFVLELNES